MCFELLQLNRLVFVLFLFFVFLKDTIIIVNVKHCGCYVLSCFSSSFLHRTSFDIYPYFFYFF